jgi:hypothetical protein
MDLTTRVIEGSGLSIPIFDGAHNNGKGQYLSEPEIIKNSLLEQCIGVHLLVGGVQGRR